MDREFPDHPSIERVTTEKIEVEGIETNPIFVFISDDFGPSDLGRGQPLQRFIQLLQKKLPGFNPINFKVLNVSSFGSGVPENDGQPWTDQDILNLQEKIILALQVSSK